MSDPFRYDIRNGDVAKELIALGFTIHNASTDCWTLEAPANMPTAKAKKYISSIIKLYVVAKELNRAQRKYNGIIAKIDELNMLR